MKRILAVVAVLALALPSAGMAREGRPDRGDQQQNAQQNGGGNRGANRGDGNPRGGNRGPAAQTNAAPPSPPQTNAGPATRLGRQNGQGPGGNTSGPAFARPNVYAPQGSVAARNNNRDSDNDNNRRFGNDNRRGDDNNNRRFGNDNDRRDNNRRFDNDRRDNDRRFGNNDNRRFDNDRRFDNNRGRFAGRNFGYQRYAGRDFRFRGRAFSAVRAPRFVYPRGYSYRRWSIGAFLPLLFLSDSYYIDYDYLGLPPPGPGEEWVRYGSDALLVDRYNGEVVDVAYNVFY